MSTGPKHFAIKRSGSIQSPAISARAAIDSALRSSSDWNLIESERYAWRLLTFGSVLAIVIWLAGSGAFAFYVSKFGSYNKTWGSLAAVVVMLTWLWLSAVALLLGAEINAEAERSRELRRGERAEVELQAPAKA